MPERIPTPEGDEAIVSELKAELSRPWNGSTGLGNGAFVAHMAVDTASGRFAKFSDRDQREPGQTYLSVIWRMKSNFLAPGSSGQPAINFMEEITVMPASGTAPLSKLARQRLVEAIFDIQKRIRSNTQ